MTDTNIGVLEIQENLIKPRSFDVEDVYWGYIVRSGRGPSFGVLLGQAFSFFFGVCFLTAALGILLLPTLFFGAEFSPMRIGSATLFGALASYLLWFASRGTEAEVHVDTSMSEIREVICNRAGRPTTVETYSFDSIGGIFVTEADTDGQATLALRYRNTDQTVAVAEASPAQLVQLRDRLGRDLLSDRKLTSVAA